MVPAFRMQMFPFRRLGDALGIPVGWQSSLLLISEMPAFHMLHAERKVVIGSRGR